MITLNYEYVTDIMPDFYRRGKTIRTDWMNLTLNGTKSGYTNFVLDYVNYNYLARHNYQTMSMEHAVNNKVSGLTLDISITDGTWLDQTYWYNSIEIFVDQEYIYNADEIPAISGDTGFTQMWMYNQFEFDEDQIDFFVIISGDTSISQESEIITLIDLYKQGGKNYEIVRI